MITAQRILDELGTSAWSGFSADDMIYTSTDSKQALTELNRGLRYLLNLKDFPFRRKEKQIETTSGAEAFTMVDGQITGIYDSKTLSELEFIGDPSQYDKEAVGTPTGYWVEYNNPKVKIRLYPIPDGVYNYNIVYNQFQPVKDKDGKRTKYEFESEADTLNIPANLEYLFMDCLVMRVIITNMKDEQDENFRPAINEFNEYWRNFIKACKPKRQNNRVVW
jgi:hypothetical protein